MTYIESPNPPCPNCGSADVFEIVHDQENAPENTSVESTDNWKYYESVWDVHPDKWKCGKCDFRWYPRDIIERDLDLLTWQLDQATDENVIAAIKKRLSTLRSVISIIVNAAS